MTSPSRAVADAAATQPLVDSIDSVDSADMPAAPAPEPRMSASELVTEFASLGDNCEFGIVQRYCDAEPPDYFKFAFSPLGSLQQAISREFAELGTPDDLEMTVSDIGEFRCRSRSYGTFDYHTEIFVGQDEEEKVRRREVNKTGYMRRRLLSDLTVGEKILVRKGDDSTSLTDMQALADGLRAFGPNLLLWVVPADKDHAPGHVELVSEGLLKGYISSFAAYDSAYLMDVASWLNLCASALRLARQLQGRPEPALLVEPVYVSQGSNWTFDPSLQNTSSEGAGVQAFTLSESGEAWLSCTPPQPSQPGQRQVASTWMRAHAGPINVYCNFSNEGKSNFRMRVTLEAADGWRRVWASSMPAGAEGSSEVVLRIKGPASGRFEVAGWRFDEGHEPGPTSSPGELVEPSGRCS